MKKQKDYPIPVITPTKDHTTNKRHAILRDAPIPPVVSKRGKIDIKEVEKIAESVRDSFDEQAKYMREQYGDYSLTRYLNQFK